jgi:hypothetical protein
MTYRFKTVILILSISLLFNIFHDLILSLEVNDSCKTEVYQVHLTTEEASSSCTHMGGGLHKHFHFVALFEFIEPTVKSLTTSTTPSYVVSISPKFILESSFKPPRV